MNRLTTVWIAAACAVLVSFALRAETAGEETQKLIEVLRSEQGVFEKAKACQRLAVVGTPEAVPVLAELLADNELAHYARFGLEPMPHAEVDAALRAALSKLDGKLRIGVINSIGARRDQDAQDALIALVASKDADLATAAAAALGRIGTPEGAAVLRSTLKKRATELGIRLGEAAIVCGETLVRNGKTEDAVSTFSAVRHTELPAHVRAAALRGEILAGGETGMKLLLATISGGDAVLRRVAFGAAREIPGQQATAALVNSLADLSEGRQVQVFRALKDRGDRHALPATLEVAGDEEAPVSVRVTAIDALTSLGDASVVPRLTRAAMSDESRIANAALATLAEMGGDDVDGAVLALLDIALARGRGERGVSWLKAVIDSAGRRNIAASVRLLRQAAQHDDETVRLTAIRALGTTVSLDEFGALVERLTTSESETETAAVRDALSMASRRMPSPADCTRALAAAMSDAPDSAKVELLGVFSAVGGAEALDVVVEAAQTSTPALRSAALGALGEWPHESAVFKILEIVPRLAKDGNGAKDRVHAYTSFQALVRRIGFNQNRRIGACVKAMELAGTNEERKLAVGALAGIPAPKTLNVLEPHLKDEQLRNSAAGAMVTICERLIRTRNRGAVAPAMKSVLDVVEDGELADRAKRMLEQASGN